jgi:hypothetical protein
MRTLARDWQLVTGVAVVLEFFEFVLLSSVDPDSSSVLESAYMLMGFLIGIALWAATWFFPRAADWRVRTRAALLASVGIPPIIFTFAILGPIY